MIEAMQSTKQHL